MTVLEALVATSAAICAARAGETLPNFIVRSGMPTVRLHAQIAVGFCRESTNLSLALAV